MDILELQNIKAMRQIFVLCLLLLVGCVLPQGPPSVSNPARNGIKAPGYLALDLPASPFGAYDATLLNAIQTRWADLAESVDIGQKSGIVAVEFMLTREGKIEALKIIESSVGRLMTLICQTAVIDPAPYARWPDDMRRFLGTDRRKMKLTFHYNAQRPTNGPRGVERI